MSSLRNNNGAPPTGGYRLQQLAVLNWGTFDQKIWTITPRGATSLLTGANGSGKSTLVDALLTLLVANQKRNYNKASGLERRGERDERTYVRGAYGKVRGDDGYQAQTRHLRGKDDYSVLTAQFCEAQKQQTVTLAQMFWFQDGTLRKFFVVATRPLSLEQDFSDFEDVAVLKKRLRSMAEVQVFDQFNKYSRRFRKLFGLDSEKALDMFNQTVTIKEVGNLNTFVRNHMLEKTNVRDDIDKLRRNYHDLTRAYEAIEKAKLQLDQLRPLMETVEKYEQMQQRIAALQGCADAVPAYFGQKKAALLTQAVAEKTQHIAQADHRLAEIEQRLARLRQQEQDLVIAISKEGGQQLQNLEREIKESEARVADKRAQAKQYDDLARRLELSPYRDEAAFYASRQKAASFERMVEAKLQEELEAQIKLGVQIDSLEARVKELEEDLQSLQQRQSQIPTSNLKIRQRILDALDIPEADIPFVGELLKVKAEERAWEGAIERLLHNFGLRLLVPAHHYDRFSGYINQTNLRGRLVFHRVSETSPSPRVHKLTEQSLYYKLEIKPDTDHYDWLSNELIEQFNYSCCEDLTQFRRERRAITQSGLIKRGRGQHEKDDRRSLHDRKTYVLGWNNRDKIAAIKEALAEEDQALRQAKRSYQEMSDTRRHLEGQRGRLQTFQQFDDFAGIDWKREEATQQQLQSQYEQLRQSSNRLQVLESQLAATQERVAYADQERKKAQDEKSRLTVRVEDYQKQQKQVEQRLKPIPLAEAEAYYSLLERDLQKTKVTLDSVDELERTWRERYLKQVGDVKQESNGLEKKIEKAMQRYKDAYSNETDEVDASIEAKDEFGAMLVRIEGDDLPRHQQRFKQLLDEKVIGNVVLFENVLKRQEEEIKENIELLNNSLAKIDYTESTFIQLAAEQNQDPEITDFRHALRTAIPDPGQPKTPQANEASFHKIKALIERFEAEERWTTKVTDVRNWLNFSASERYKADNKERHYYSDSSGKSGGQKAKLAYTILASAIAYQYGLDHGQRRSKSFRFVVVDEAFSKSDEANARYAMELFGKLDLQLLVVTPLDKIHVIESYISACHFVTNNAEENDSRVVDMTIDEYHQQKQAFLNVEASRVTAV